MLGYLAAFGLAVGVAGWIAVGIFVYEVAKWVVRRAVGVALLRPM